MQGKIMFRNESIYAVFGHTYTYTTQRLHTSVLNAYCFGSGRGEEVWKQGM